MGIPGNKKIASYLRTNIVSYTPLGQALPFVPQDLSFTSLIFSQKMTMRDKDCISHPPLQLNLATSPPSGQRTAREKWHVPLLQSIFWKEA